AVVAFTVCRAGGVRAARVRLPSLPVGGRFASRILSTAGIILITREASLWRLGCHGAGLTRRCGTIGSLRLGLIGAVLLTCRISFECADGIEFDKFRFVQLIVVRHNFVHLTPHS